MPEHPPHAEMSQPAARGAARFAWFDGILEAPRGDVDALRRAVHDINSCNFAHVDLALDGGRVSILMDNRVVGPSGMTDENRAALVRGLSSAAASIPHEAAIESTLRCTEVFEFEVRETLFVAARGELRSMSRIRTVTAEDLAHAPHSEPAWPILRMSRARLALIGALFLLFFGIIAWQGGWLDRVLAADAQVLKVDTGPFGQLLTPTIKESWGSYIVTLKRGTEYPATNADQDRLLAAAADPAQRAALNAVIHGDSIYVRVEDGQGKVLGHAKVELRSFVSTADAKMETRLAGRSDAALLRLALDSGTSGK